MPKVLIVGAGGREHALAWKLAQEAEVTLAPGNPGMDYERAAVSADDTEGLVALADRMRPDLIVVGPENPLVAGLADRLRVSGHAVYGPGQTGAQLEASKAFSKAVMIGAGVPTADYAVCSDAVDARRAIKKYFGEGKQVAVKASGAALGKGVAVCDDEDQALEAVQLMMVDRVFGASGDTVVIEERLMGHEFSLLTLCSDAGFHSLPVAQDYKRAFDGDKGPNTGGMGSYSPVDWVTDDLIRRTEAEVVAPAIAFMKAQGIAYRGTLFSGLMATEQGVKCLEYNVRFGDPETQSIIRRLGSGFFDALLAAANGQPIPEIEVLDVASVTLVIANEGYPGMVSKRPEIRLPDRLPEGVELFFAGVDGQEGALVASGGRILNVSAIGQTLEEARFRAYVAAESIEIDGSHFRRDIAAHRDTFPGIGAEL